MAFGEEGTGFDAWLQGNKKKAKGKRELINPVNYDKGANLKMGFGADGAGELRRYGKEGAVGLS